MGVAAYAPDGDPIEVDPEDTDRVFLDVVAYNSKVYYVLGDVATPGRLPITGNETVLDAIYFAGGLASTGDPGAIRLVRAGRDGAGPRSYTVDLKGIVERGESGTNYQLFPGDRLLVGRNPTVVATMELDRATARVMTAQASILAYADTLKRLRETAPDLPREQLESVIQDWMRFWLEVGARPLDEEAFREALIRKLGPNPGEGDGDR